MLELDIAPSLFAQEEASAAAAAAGGFGLQGSGAGSPAGGGGAGLYRCRTFPGLQDLLQQQDSDSEEEEG